ncbi:hypothetical protein CAPTEDRAFT_218182 [Capitella teleta]|uniref:SOCS box domain-containing protein n=1 Tax=Capitella teleta TaxID=283909 RepID=R7TLN8_CAPTE|nr:hypothetical protein CAPTEDRAFT_218182 [Capitella teleta]|eukprot:ELT94417.1 hypothetical protein CAPTEDRAFT_218182 [Capitella teleta]
MALGKFPWQIDGGSWSSLSYNYFKKKYQPGDNIVVDSIKVTAKPASGSAMKALHEVIVKGDVKRLSELLQRRPHCLSECFSNGLSPLVLALQRASDDVVAALLRLGADPGQSCQASSLQAYNYKRTYHTNIWAEDDYRLDVQNPANNPAVFPLDVAVGMEQVGNVKLLLSHGANPCEHCTAGLFRLALFAIEHQSLDLLRLLLQMGKGKGMHSGVYYAADQLKEHLNLAVSKGLIAFVKLLLEFGAYPDSEYNHSVPLVIAADNENLAMCRLLIDAGASLSSPLNSRPVLARALLANSLNAVRNLIALGCDVNATVYTCFLPSHYHLSELGLACPMIHLAICKRNLEALQMLLEAGARTHDTDMNMNTVLHASCDKKTALPASLFNKLLKILPPFCPNWQRKILDARNAAGLTPLMVAAKNGRADLALALLQCKADPGVHAQPKMERKTALHLAVDSGDEACLLAVLRNGCKVDVRCSGQRTALHVAVQQGNVNFVEILVSHGAKVHAETRWRECCLHLAINAQSLDMVKYLTGQNHRVNIANSNGETALMLAARQSDADICQHIIDRGALLDVRDKQGETAFMYSIFMNRQLNSISLIREGANPYIGQVKHASPLYRCFFHNQLRTLQLLIISGVRFTRSHLEFYPKNLPAAQDRRLMQWLEHRLQNPRSLQEMARQSARSWLILKAGGKGMLRLLPRVPLPEKLKSYLMFESSDENLEEIDPSM